MKKLQKLDDFKKFAILKKGIGIESQKTIQITKKYRNKMKLNDCYRTKVGSETFAIPILTARLGAVRIGIANFSESTFVL